MMRPSLAQQKLLSVANSSFLEIEVPEKGNFDKYTINNVETYEAMMNFNTT